VRGTRRVIGRHTQNEACGRKKEGTDRWASPGAGPNGRERERELLTGGPS
jgi:hypothetical protein